MMRSLEKLFDLQDRVAVVTGGAGHIGTTIVETLVELGAMVLCVDQVAEHRHAIRQRNKVVDLTVDLSQPKASHEVLNEVKQRFGRLDVLINNAAYTGNTALPGYSTDFGQQSLEAWDAALRVNVSAAFLMAQSARTELAKNGVGAIVNVASIYGLVGPDLRLYEGTGMGNPAAYGVSKGGLLQLTRYLATVLSPDIRVNSISPGGLARSQPAAFTRRYQARAPLRRMGTEEDLKGAIAYLASDASAYVTGQNLTVDGGWTIW